jgi:hypothetical protein
MHRVLAVVPILALAACAGGHAAVTPKTRLDVRVDDGHQITRYTLTCRPAGGSAPDPAGACRALEDFLPRLETSHGACACALYVKRIAVRGVLDGRRLRSPAEVSGCSVCDLGTVAAGDVPHAFAAFHLTPG